MDKEIFRTKPGKDTCDCIICHKKNVEASDEHIIPLALGGVMHTWNVCKTCNSRFGEDVDTLLTDHDLISFQRHQHRLRGQSKQIPASPLEGTFQGDDGEKYRVEYNDGKFEAHPFPKFIEEGRGHLTLSIDPRDLKKADDMIKKYCRRKHYKIDETQRRVSPVYERPAPEVTVNLHIDIMRFRLAIVKIAYEFAATLFPDLLHDETMTRIADILHDAAFDRLGELVFIGNGFNNLMPMILGDFVDFDNPKRHYIFLTNLDDGLYCCVKLFNTFFLGVKLSDKVYNAADNAILAINDFEKHQYDLYTLEELADKVNAFSGVSFILSGSKSETTKFPEPVCCTPDGECLLFTTPELCAGPVTLIMSRIPEAEVSTSIENGISTTTYEIGGRLGFLTQSGKLLPLDSIISRSRITKI
ncbi:MAG: HNH endonuclease [Muribaculaceae bacterium]|nr:HNH endonuclease [Muribaculaceae bacterium]